jgi:anthranilate phosphoribosyltransferase
MPATLKCQRQFCQYHLQGEVFMEYESIVDAAQDICIAAGVFATTVCSECSGTLNLDLGSLGYTVMKHGSWKNTTAVWSSEAINKLWIPLVYKTLEEFRKVFKDTGFVYTDAVVSKTIHDLSWSILKTETVNHLTWPMTPPISSATRFHKVLGINHNINIDALWKAYEFLNERWIYNVWNVIIVWWLGQLPEEWEVPKNSLIRLDEFSPRWSLIWVIINGTYKGQYVISDVDFWTKIDLEESLISGENEGSNIYSANDAVLDNRAPRDLIELVACNSALWLITLNGSMDKDDFIVWGEINTKYLTIAFKEAMGTISSLKVRKYLDHVKNKIKEIAPGAILSY